MKKNNNIKQLKKWMINRSTDKIECYVYGVHAYNISANEYEVIVAYQKINGRYYFIDRDGNKYLASRYDRADQVAGEIVENVNNAVLSVISSCNELQTKGQTVILEDVKDLFLEFSGAIGLEFEVKKTCSSEFGESTITYILKGYNEKNSENEESAEDEQGCESEEQQTESEASATTCEPSVFYRILAKAETAAAKAKAFFSILAKMEWYSFILFGPSLVMLGVVTNCIYLLASGACPDMGRAVEGIVLFGLLAFVFAFGGFFIAGDEWDDAKKEVLIKSK